jgi:hypothetical protein
LIDRDLALGSVDIVHGSQNTGMIRQRIASRLLERWRQQTVRGLGRRQSLGRVADGLAIGRNAVSQRGFGGDRLGTRIRQSRFRLSDIGARDLARGETVAALAQLLLQNIHVLALKFEFGGIA